MKKILLIALIAVFMVSCGPKRMKCYGKRCVETTVKKDVVKSSKANS